MYHSILLVVFAWDQLFLLFYQSSGHEGEISIPWKKGRKVNLHGADHFSADLAVLRFASRTALGSFSLASMTAGVK